MQAANHCCNNPAACISGSTSSADSQQRSGEGLRDYCERLKSAGAANSSANTSASSMCSANISKCQSTCSSGDDEMKRNASTCSALTSRVQQLAQQALSSGTSSAYAQHCSNLAGENNSNNYGPQSQNQNGNNNNNNKNGNGSGLPGMGGGPGGSSSPSSSSPYDYGNNQNNQNPTEQNRPSLGTAGYHEGGGIPGSENFNVGSTDGPQTQFNSSNATGENTGGRPPQVNTVANNSGGSIPGSDGGSGANLRGQGARGAPGSPGYTTDVLQGFQNGGGGSPGSNSANQWGSDDGSYGGGSGRRNPSNAKAPGAGLDLRQYLPGGAHNPRVQAGGHRGARAADINGSHVNIWGKISDRILQKCRLGELIDCR